MADYLTMLRIKLALLVSIFCACLLRANAADSPQVIRYTIASNGKVAGSEVDTYYPDGRIESTFEFNDRGRGPKISSKYQLDAGRLPVRVDETGNDYLKAPVDEHFEIKDGKASWHSTAEKGEAPAGAFYVSNNGPSAEVALMVAALKKANGAPLRLFPSGDARLERMTDLTLEDHGQRIHVTEYGITGLSFEPQTVWLDDENRFFGFPGTWFSLLREGWEKTNDQLYALDLKARDERNARLAKQLSRHPVHAVAIEHVRLFDSEQAVMRENQTVVIAKDRFVSGRTFWKHAGAGRCRASRWDRQNDFARIVRHACACAGSRRDHECRERRHQRARHGKRHQGSSTSRRAMAERDHHRSARLEGRVHRWTRRIPGTDRPLCGHRG